MILKRARCVFSVFLLLSFIFVFSVNAASAEDNKGKVVTVAYYEANNFQLGKDDGEMKSGYSYEVLQKISDYTGWQYNYVYGDWALLYKEFKEGKIDLFAGLIKDDRRLGVFSFSDVPIDIYTEYIFVKKDDVNFLVNDINLLNGKRIGLIGSEVLLENLENWGKKNNLNFTPVLFNKESLLLPALEKGEIDALISAETIFDNTDNLRPFAFIQRDDVFLCARKGASEISTELNDALRLILDSDPNYFTKLRLNYYNNISTMAVLSEIEEDWLLSHSSLRLGIISDYVPYCFVDDEGNVTGVITDIADQWLSKLQIADKIEIKYVIYKNYTEMLAGLMDEEIDCAFPVPSDRWYSEQSNMMETSDLVHAQMVALFLNEFTENTFNTVAISARPLQTIYCRKYLPESKLIRVHSGEECVNAVIEGIASSTILSNFRANLYLNQYKSKNLKMMVLENGMSYSIGLRKGDIGLLSLLNRGIAMMDSSLISDSLYSYYVYTSSYTLHDFINEHIVFFIFGVIGVLLIIVVVFFLYTHGLKRAKEEIQAQIDVAQALSSDYLHAVFIDVKNDRYIIAKSDGFILPYKKRDFEKADGSLWGYVSSKYEILGENDLLSAHLSFESIIQSLKYNKEHYCIFNSKWDGMEHTLQVTFSKTYSKTYKRYYILAGIRIIDDIVAMEKSQKELLQNALDAAENSNKAKSAFLSSMSHDIRTPLNAISGFTALAMGHLNSKKEVKNYLEKISVSTNHLLSLINDVLEMSRIESGKMKIREEEISITSLIEEAVTMIQSNLQLKNICLDVDTSSISNDCVIADKLKLNQVLINILGNSIKFTEPMGKIWVTVNELTQFSNEYGQYEFKIRDTGIGMSPEFVDHIFEAFSREQTSTVSKIPGTGLGMTICKSIVDMMGGTITVSSEEGKGSEFVVHLQLKIRGEKHKDEKVKKLKSIYASAKRFYGNKRILLVEDNELNQEIAATILKEAGFTVEIADDGSVAVEMIRTAKRQIFDVVLMDVQMPKMNGYDATKEIRKMNGWKGTIPIVAMTANAFDEDKQKSLAVGMNAHITKPIDIPTLLTVISELA